MGQLIPVLMVLAVLIVVVVMVGLATGKLGTLLRFLAEPAQASRRSSDDSPAGQYKVRADAVLTEAERVLASVLEQTAHLLIDDPPPIGGPLRVLAKVRLGDLIQPDEPGADRSRLTRLRNAIHQQHVDFVLVDHGWRPVCVVELDDRSHGSKRVQAADAKKTGALASAGLPLARVQTGSMRDVDAVLESIRSLNAAIKR